MGSIDPAVGPYHKVLPSALGSRAHHIHQIRLHTIEGTESNGGKDIEGQDGDERLVSNSYTNEDKDKEKVKEGGGGVVDADVTDGGKKRCIRPGLGGFKMGDRPSQPAKVTCVRFAKLCFTFPQI